ncbi:class I adenylate-forming enzyme family protein [Prevotella melaninogenica]|uniref:class I adenylate-forming enzyme family protein n=1 Tax=Prevotella melaninogenica TaxID=28132 RepID=UPI001C5D5EB4|nr:AMP-binding protein [Prevotella melaninogenica]MBW4728412.1 AMP-binding protein [Prevotella melaninogenica]MBW4730904.1 AMP-binding protein [Prevotella melaninogenica]MBW4749165.1 AMP-binding protein [Prevotella melaninogenica]
MRRKNEAILSILYRLHIISPKGIFVWAKSLISEGISLMALLRFAAHFYPQRCAIIDEKQSLSYQDLYIRTHQLAEILHTEYHLHPQMSVALLGRNSIILTLLLHALSRLGIRTTLLSTDLGTEQITAELQKHRYHLIIYDSDIKQIPTKLPCIAVTTERLNDILLHNTSLTKKRKLPKIWRGSEIVIHSGGTSGNFKTIARRPSVTSFLPPLFALLRDIQIYQYERVLISLPFYHGFGLSTLIISLLMGKKICLQKRFDALQTLAIIQQEKIEVMPIVPAMLARFWQIEGAKKKMKSLRCLISGGDRLPKSLIDTTHKEIGEVIFNLYGTSEAGFFMLANPKELVSFKETTLGKPIRGVDCKVKDCNRQGIGTLWVRSRWAMRGLRNQWQNTGDLVSQNSEGYFFHHGRADRMIVCGGENVQPEHIEQVLLSHPMIIAARAFTVPDPNFGNVIHTEIECTPKATLTEATLLNWLRPQLSRAEMPHSIRFKTIEMLSTGKQKAR